MVELINVICRVNKMIDVNKELGKIVLACLSKTSPLGTIGGLTCPLTIEGPRYFDRAKVA